MLRALLPALLVAAALLPAANALPAPVVALAGTASGTMAGCAAGDALAITGASDGDGTWTFVVTRANPLPDLDCPTAQAGVFHGAWDPAVGGCVGALVTTDADGFCLGPVAAGPVSTSYELCKGFAAGNCHGCSVGTFSGAAA